MFYGSGKQNSQGSTKRYLCKIGASVLFVIMMLVVVGCDVFEYSPYQTNLDDDDTRLTTANLTKLNGIVPEHPDSFTFAVIADNHSHYDELLNAIGYINVDTTIAFVIHLGDLSEMGLLREYEWVRDILRVLSKPYFVVIGNHDCLSNGVRIYRKMFGELDFTFTFGNTKFVLINDNAWEFDGGVPDYDFLENELADRQDCTNLIVAAHVPPFGDQMSRNDNEATYVGLMNDHGVALSMHGHTHWHYHGHYYDDDVDYLVAEDLRDSWYYVVTVARDSISVEGFQFD